MGNKKKVAKIHLQISKNNLVYDSHITWHAALEGGSGQGGVTRHAPPPSHFFSQQGEFLILH